MSSSSNWVDGLKPSNLRNTMQENSMVVSVVMGILLLCGVMLIGYEAGWFTHKPRGPSGVYFIDEETDEVTVQPATEIAPLKGSGGKMTVVNVVYYTCTTCAARKPAYYMKYTDEAKAYIEQHRNDPPPPGDRPKPLDLVMAQLRQTGQLVRLPERGSPWVLMVSPEGLQIQSRAQQNCPGSAYHVCVPE